MKQFVYALLVLTLVGAASAEPMVRDILSRGLFTRGAPVPPPIPDPAPLVNAVCLPTCDMYDARMLSVTSDNLSTHSTSTVARIQVPGFTSEFEFSVFDGEMSQPTVSTYWDYGPEQNTNFDIYAGTTLVASFDGITMSDNVWETFVIPHHPDAFDGSDYHYTVVIELDDSLLPQSWNNYKIGVGLPAQLFLQDIVTFTAPLFSVPEVCVVYPGYPGCDTGVLSAPTSNPILPTTYDGTLEFNVFIEQGTKQFIIWDGDFDFGTEGELPGSALLDTDDPNTVGIPSFGGLFSRPEGVAFVDATDSCTTTYSLTACPADDRAPNINNAFWSRAGAVVYSVEFSDGQVFSNVNPSGNREWEKFNISSRADCASKADFCIAEVPWGPAVVRISGLDMSNQVSLKFKQDVDAGECPVN